MKKVIQIFHKKKKADAPSVDAVSEAPRNISRYVVKPSDLYNNFSAYKTNETNSCNMNSVIPKNVEPSSSNNVENRPSVSSERTSNCELDVASLSDESEFLSDVSTEIDNSVKHASRPTANVLTVQEKNDTPEPHNGTLIKRENKSGGSTYMITISNSTHFHIGSQKTINYFGSDDNNLKEKDLKLANASDMNLLSLDSNELLNINNTLSSDDLLEISLSVRSRWRDFVRNLGTDENTIQELEDLSDKDYNLIVYDILQQYMTQHPKTTVGFMISILQKSNETEAVRKLIKKR